MEVKITEGHQVSQPAPQVRVTNRNEFDIEDSFDGIPYTFPGRSFAREDVEKKTPLFRAITVPPEAAAHFFAYGLHATMPPKQQLQAMFEHISRRYGWNTAEREKEGRSREYFRNIDIRPVMFKLVEDSDEEGSTRQRGKSA